MTGSLFFRQLPDITGNSNVGTIRPNWRVPRVFLAIAPIAGLREMLEHGFRTISYDDDITVCRLYDWFELQAGKDVQGPQQIFQRSIGLQLIQLDANDRFAARFTVRSHDDIHIRILALKHGARTFESALD